MGDPGCRVSLFVGDPISGIISMDILTGIMTLYFYLLWRINRKDVIDVIFSLM